MSFGLRSKLALETLKFGIYVAVPIALVVVIALPRFRRSVLDDQKLSYPATDADRPISSGDLERLREFQRAARERT